jgi:hypothetical protein
MYGQYTSYVISDANATDSAEHVEMMAAKTMTRIRTDPVLPNNAVATAAGTKPADASDDVIGNIRATLVNPNVEAKPNGIANQHILVVKTVVEEGG